MQGKALFLVPLISVTMFAVACNSGGGAVPAAPIPATAPAPPLATPPGLAPATSLISASNVIDVRTGEEPHVFTPDSLILKLGETYQISVKGGAEFHTFTAPDFSVNKVVQPGETVAITLTATKAGTFPFVCTPHDGLGMRGTINVAP